MNQNSNQNSTQATRPGAQAAHATPDQDNQDHRSEGLLPADENDPSLQVAEEVAFDLQSDEARRVGSMPKDGGQASPADAVAESLRSGKGDAEGNSSRPQ